MFEKCLEGTYRIMQYNHGIYLVERMTSFELIRETFITPLPYPEKVFKRLRMAPICLIQPKARLIQNETN